MAVRPLLVEEVEVNLLSNVKCFHPRLVQAWQALNEMSLALPFQGMHVEMAVCGHDGYALLHGFEADGTVSMQLDAISAQPWTVHWLAVAERTLSRVEAASWAGSDGWEGLAARRETRYWGADEDAESHLLEPRIIPIVLELERLGMTARYSCEGHPVARGPQGGYLSLGADKKKTAQASHILEKAGFRVMNFGSEGNLMMMAAYSPQFSDRVERDCFMRAAWESIRHA